MKDLSKYKNRVCVILFILLIIVAVSFLWKTRTNVIEGLLSSELERTSINNDACSDNFFMKSVYETDMCDKTTTDNPELEKKCNSLSFDNCNLSSCCVLLDGNKCVAGDMSGPIFKSKNNVPIEYNFYSYQGKRYENDSMTE